jgi:hypothetical protein
VFFVLLCATPLAARPAAVADPQPTVDRVMTVRGKCAPSGFRSWPDLRRRNVEPQHGTVAVQVPHRVVYTARAGYVGNDSFAYARKGLSTQNAPVTFSVRVAVRVVR